ncbi:MAG: ATP-binding protein [Candidatus Komeilibacteria bacterium]|nr:ATP-binding protein [Candidatus Komeilibacteria bacterium]
MIAKTKSIEEELIKESIFIIGHVLSVDGRIIKIKLNKNKNHSHILYEGKTVKNVSVGSYIKVVKGFVSIIGKVEGEFTSEEKYYNKEYNKEEAKINRILQVSLFGHFEGTHFKQGIKEMPLIDNECYLLNRDEFNSLHHFYKNGEKTITIGNLTEEPSQKIKIGVNNLFASHIGIFGNTGSGKSNTLAKIYTELFKVFSNNNDFKTKSDFVVVDFNGEYIGDEMITKDKVVYELSTGKKVSKKKYPISKDSIHKTEILSVLLEATEKTQKPFLDRVIRNDFLDDNATFNARVITSIEDTCTSVIDKKDRNLREGLIIELFRDLINLVTDEKKDAITNLKKEVENNLHYHSKNEEYYWDNTNSTNFNNTSPIYTTHLKTLVENLVFKSDEFSKLKLKIVFNYFHEIIKGYSNQEHIGPLIGRMFRKFDMLEKLIDINENTESKNLSIICLRDVNIEMKKIIPLIIAKQLYENKKESDKKSLHIVIDEAHNILSTMSQRESETWKDYRLETFEEIIKEGRKFGVFLTIASQRPYDISATIISQLHNYFIHRLINDNDINAVEKAVAYLDKLSFQSIPILSVGSCFVAGLASDIPVKVDIDLLEMEKRPNSGTVNLEGAWNSELTQNNKDIQPIIN